MDAKSLIRSGKTYLGIELGSTRIKAVLIGEDFCELASGAHNWQSHVEDGFWSYRLEDALQGVQAAFGELCRQAHEKYGEWITQIDAIGISAMMHGYIALDKQGKLLTPFRTWRNTTTERAAAELTERFGFNIPQRWSIAHLYQAVLDREAHVSGIASMTTLAGYVHHALTQNHGLGVGDASGMFPIADGSYNKKMVSQFLELTGLDIDAIFPPVLLAGDKAGQLTSEGAALLDARGQLKSGSIFCPPEGDAGTGMVATNSVLPGTSNVSAGTSVFAMLTLSRELSRVYPEVDMVTTPMGAPVAMVHCNSCTADIDAWAGLFMDLVKRFAPDTTMEQLYNTLFAAALDATLGFNGIISYNYFSGEPIVGLDSGMPLLIRNINASLTLPNFMRTQLFSAIATLRLGMDLLTAESIRLDRLFGHGGFFKAGDAGQRVMAAGLKTPVSVMEGASEGGAWGIALLAAYMRHSGMPLDEFLSSRVFHDAHVQTIEPCKVLMRDFDVFIKPYKSGLSVMKAAIEWR